jgi:hypothetical protein
MEHVEKTEFPWLMSNVVDNETGRPLAEGKVSHVLEWWGRKIGLVSLSVRLIINVRNHFIPTKEKQQTYSSLRRKKLSLVPQVWLINHFENPIYVHLVPFL